MDNDTLYADLLKLNKEEALSKSKLLRIIKEYANKISVFDLMNFMAYSDSTFEGVPDKWKVLGNKMQVETFINRISEIKEDDTTYDEPLDNEEFRTYVENLKDTENQLDESLKKGYLICIVSILYANHILEEPVHPEGTEFPGSVKVIEKEGTYYCPAKEGNLENPNAFCRLCLAEQLDV